MICLRSREDDDYGFTSMASTRPSVSNGQPPLPVLKNLTHGAGNADPAQQQVIMLASLFDLLLLRLVPTTAILL